MSDLVVAFCPTFSRSHLLARAIAAWEAQTFSERLLICVDDSGQLDSQKSEQGKWEIVSLSRRCRSLSEKNNLCISLAPPHAKKFMKFDDDDLVYPWACEAAAEALDRGIICQPRFAVDWDISEWVITPTHSPGTDSLEVGFCYHGTWSFTEEFFLKMRGYAPLLYAGDDGELDQRRRDMGIRSVGLDKRYKPYYKYFSFYHRHHPEALLGCPGPISQRGGSHAAYLDTPRGQYLGRLPEYKGPPIWLDPLPTKVLERRRW